MALNPWSRVLNIPRLWNILRVLGLKILDLRLVVAVNIRRVDKSV